MEPQLTGIYISAIAAFFAGVSILLAWRQLRATHEWNKRKSSDDALRFLVSGDYQRLTNQFHGIVPFEEWTREHSSYLDIRDRLTDEQRAQASKHSWDLLNIFESLCIGMKNRIIDEEICHDYLAFILPRFFRWSRHFIEEVREATGEPRLYTELEDYARKWTERDAEEGSAADRAARGSGKPES